MLILFQYPKFDPNGPLVEPDASLIASEAPSLVAEPEPVIDLAFRAPTFVALGATTADTAAPLFADFQFAPPPSDLRIEDPVAPRLSDLRMEEPVNSGEVALTGRHAAPIVFVAWWLLPLALVNRIYDGSTSWLGPIGRGLRSRPMRNLLGICGLAALVGAAAWVLWEGTDWNS